MSDKIMFCDIETSYNICKGIWRPGKQYINPNQIIKERQIISVSWMWEGEKQKDIKTLDWGLKKQNDKLLLTRFQKVCEKADVIIGQNSDNFDIKFIRGRLWYHNLPNIQPLITLDTLKMSRSAFNLNSHKLDYKLKFKGCPGKLKTDMELWDRVMEGDKGALEYMIKYNKKDVWDTAKHYKDIKPYCDIPKYHIGCGKTGNAKSCRSCGHTVLHSVGIVVTRGTTSAIKRRWYKCQGCGRKQPGEVL